MENLQIKGPDSEHCQEAYGVTMILNKGYENKYRRCTVGLSLTRGDEMICISWDYWDALLNLAKRFGWIPMEKLSHYQAASVVITSDDARNFAKALGRALEQSEDDYPLGPGIEPDETHNELTISQREIISNLKDFLRDGYCYVW